MTMKPPADWLPGLVAGNHFAVNGAVCTLNYAEVYPEGVTASISIRFRGRVSDSEDGAARHQIDAAAKGSPVSGPRLVLKQAGALNAYGTLISVEGEPGFWTLRYWFIHRTLPVECRFHLVWSEAGIDATFVLSEGPMAAALDAMEDLTDWPFPIENDEDEA
ncbi:hypothetical protein ACIQTZ_21995 [Paenarthrobacter sp. NPDC090520]|uniref:hypothetical protein n=1 Tax=Paenarthrobacter sp. NPDC090520 TaxID=3364382 RepID=UPI00382DAC51